MSRRHAQIAWNGAGCSVSDLRGKNGTYVDGHRLGTRPVQLHNGQQIVLGRDKVILAFQFLGDSTLEDRVAGRETSPCGRASLGLRDRKVGRNAPSQKPQELIVSVDKREVFVRGRRVTPPLPRKEFDVLAFLAANAGRACSMAGIGDNAWPERPPGCVDNREIAQRLRQIRVRIELDPSRSRYIVNVRGLAEYRLDPSKTALR